MSALFILSLLVQTSLLSLAVAQVDTSREDQLLETALKYIETNRKGTAQIQFIDETTGTPVSGTEVQYQQTSHDFMFSTHFWAAPERMQQLGLEWSGDVWLSWSEIEPTKGVYDFSKPDGTISWQRQYKRVRLWGRLTSLFLDWNHLESPRPPAFADFDHINDPTVFANYKDLVYRFVFSVGTHYKGIISAYMTQIEINWPGNAVSTGLSKRPAWTIQQAVELNKVVSKALRDADPSAIIILGTSTPWRGPFEYDTDPLQFTKLCLASGVYVDLVALEAYPSDGSPALFYDYVKMLAKPGKPVFINEIGYPSTKPDVDESWLKSWKWHVFNEDVQALWFWYLFVLTFGMREAAGVSIVAIRDAEPTSLYSTTITHVSDQMGLFTVTWEPKKSVGMLRELIANFSTSGTARTDDNGTFTLRGFAGNYTVHVKWYEPVTIHISEGQAESLTMTVSRERTPEYDDALEKVNSARLTLAGFNATNLQSQEAKRLAEEASREYELAVASLNKWELDAARTHADRSKQLVNQALQAETMYREQLQTEQFQRNTQLLSIAAAVVLVFGLTAIFVTRNRRQEKERDFIEVRSGLNSNSSRLQTSNKRLTRRQYIKCAGAGVAAIGTATAVTLFGLPAIDPYAFDRPPTADFEYKPYYSDPRYPINPTYVNPTSGYTIHFLDRSTDPDNEDNTQSQIKKLLGYTIPQPLRYSWYVDDMQESTARDFSTKLPADSFETAHRVRLSVSDGRQLSNRERALLVDPDQLYPVSRLNTKVKGVVYWVDCPMPHLGSELNEDYIRSDLNLIRDELSCNAIRINSGVCEWSLNWQDELVRCSEMAIETGFDIIRVGPRYFDDTLDETVERVRAFAPRAEKLRDVSDAIVFEVGNELSVDARGICETISGYNARTREFDEKSVPWNPAHSEYQRRLNDLLRRLVAAARESYRGKLSYAAHPGEWGIPWGELDFDIVGQNQYWWPECTGDQEFVEILTQRKTYGKPVHVTEFGCTTYQGSFELGGRGYEGTGVYDEDAQASGIRHYLELINASEVDGCFLFAFRAAFVERPSRYSLIDAARRKKSFYMYKNYERSL